MRNKKNIAIGDVINFHSGNFEGLNATIIEVNWNSNDPLAIYGFLHKAKLENGSIVYIEKSEHWDYVV